MVRPGQSLDLRMNAPCGRDSTCCATPENWARCCFSFRFRFTAPSENIAYLEKLMKQFSDYPLVVEVRHAHME